MQLLSFHVYYENLFPHFVCSIDYISNTPSCDVNELFFYFLIAMIGSYIYYILFIVISIRFYHDLSLLLLWRVNRRVGDKRAEKSFSLTMYLYRFVIKRDNNKVLFFNEVLFIELLGCFRGIRMKQRDWLIHLICYLRRDIKYDLTNKTSIITSSHSKWN